MEERNNSLYQSLVGTNLEFRRKGEHTPMEVVEGDVENIKKMFGDFKQLHYSFNAAVCVAMMFSYYFKKSAYYIMVRRYFTFGRYREIVMKVLDKSPNEQQEILLKAVKRLWECGTLIAQEMALMGTRYFLKVYPSRRDNILDGTEELKRFHKELRVTIF